MHVQTDEHDDRLGVSVGKLWEGLLWIGEAAGSHMTQRTCNTEDDDDSETIGGHGSGGAALTSHLDSCELSRGFSFPTTLADGGDWGSGVGGMGRGRGMGLLCSSGVSGIGSEAGWIMITVVPVGLEQENPEMCVQFKSLC